MIFASKEYLKIKTYYGSRKAERSGVLLITHIDEGLSILQYLGASLVTQKAYCLHPILQADEALTRNWKDHFSGINPQAIILAMEYRRIANAYLSTRSIRTINDIEMSPLVEVKQMLIADKVQNRNNFELYHLPTHPRSKQLQKYFRNWLQKLGISEVHYQELISYL